MRRADAETLAEKLEHTLTCRQGTFSCEGDMLIDVVDEDDIGWIVSMESEHAMTWSHGMRREDAVRLGMQWRNIVSEAEDARSSSLGESVMQRIDRAIDSLDMLLEYRFWTAFWNGAIAGPAEESTQEMRQGEERRKAEEEEKRAKEEREKDESKKRAEEKRAKDDEAKREKEKLAKDELKKHTEEKRVKDEAETRAREKIAKDLAEKREKEKLARGEVEKRAEEKRAKEEAEKRTEEKRAKDEEKKREETRKIEQRRQEDVQREQMRKKKEEEQLEKARIQAQQE
jgi:hypothetical protein